MIIEAINDIIVAINDIIVVVHFPLVTSRVEVNGPPRLAIPTKFRKVGRKNGEES